MIFGMKIEWALFLVAMVIISILIIVIVASAIPYRSVIVEVNVIAEAKLDDKLAIVISKNALQKAKLLAPLLQPTSYDGKNIFARNLYNPNNGYVIWKWGDQRNPGYTVQIEREGPIALCRIGLNKS